MLKKIILCVVLLLQNCCFAMLGKEATFLDVVCDDPLGDIKNNIATSLEREERELGDKFIKLYIEPTDLQTRYGVIRSLNRFDAEQLYDAADFVARSYYIEMDKASPVNSEEYLAKAETALKWLTMVKNDAPYMGGDLSVQENGSEIPSLLKSAEKECKRRRKF